MKHIKLFEDFKDNSDLEKELDRYGIENYTINTDGTIDVDGNVNLSFSNLDKIPFKFGKVTGSFHCFNNKLNSLEGSPYYIGGDFSCYINKLTNLEGSPSEVGGNVNCYNNDLISVSGMPIEIGGFFNCFGNPNLKELDSISNIEGDIVCDEHLDTNKFKGYCKEIQKYGIGGGRISDLLSGYRYYDDINENIDAPGPELYKSLFNEKLEKAKDELEGFLQLFQDLECNCSIRIYSEDKYGKDYKSFDDISAEDFINHVRRTSRNYKLNDVSIMLIVSKATINDKEINLLKDTIKSVKSMLEFTHFSIEDLSSTEYISEKRRIKRFVLDLCFYSEEKKVNEGIEINKHLRETLNKEQLEFIDRFVTRYSNYKLNPDKSIDIEGNVYIFRSTSLPIKIPIKFGKVNGNFICNDCGLKSLENMPDYVSGDFECNQNNLINLIGSPSDVGRNFKCYKNKLESIEGMPLEIGGNFVCYDNNIKEIDSVSNIEGALLCDKNVDLKKFAGYYKSLHKI